MYIIPKDEYMSLKKTSSEHGQLIDSIKGDVNGGQVNHIEIGEGGRVVIKPKDIIASSPSKKNRKNFSTHYKEKDDGLKDDYETNGESIARDDNVDFRVKKKGKRKSENNADDDNDIVFPSANQPKSNSNTPSPLNTRADAPITPTSPFHPLETVPHRTQSSVRNADSQTQALQTTDFGVQNVPSLRDGQMQTSVNGDDSDNRRAPLPYDNDFLNQDSVYRIAPHVEDDDDDVNIDSDDEEIQNSNSSPIADGNATDSDSDNEPMIDDTPKRDVQKVNSLVNAKLNAINDGSRWRNELESESPPNRLTRYATRSSTRRRNKPPPSRNANPIIRDKDDDNEGDDKTMKLIVKSKLKSLNGQKTPVVRFVNESPNIQDIKTGRVGRRRQKSKSSTQIFLPNEASTHIKSKSSKSKKDSKKSSSTQSSRKRVRVERDDEFDESEPADKAKRENSDDDDDDDDDNQKEKTSMKAIIAKRLAELNGVKTKGGGKSERKHQIFT